MSTRTPKLAPPEEIPEGTNIMYLLHCELVTPMYGGGVKAATIDKQMPIRASSIRGQLRFWWRLLAEKKWKLGDNKTIRNAELALWGGMADGDNGTASKVTVRVNNIQNLVIEPWADYMPNNKGKDVLKPRKWADLPYVLFPAQGRTKENPNEPPHDLAREGLLFDLHLSFAPVLNEDDKGQVIETLRWWSQFGGVGARTRRGLGAVWVKENDKLSLIHNPITSVEAEAMGCKLVQGSSASPDAFAQLKASVEKLANFCQKAGLGRNAGQPPKPAGRSRWPEPDAIRRITDNKNPIHPAEHLAGNVFPRAMFGLPIIFHFVGIDEPRDAEASPERGDRLPSPLIIRPFLSTNKSTPTWKASVLVLPYQHLKDQKVSIKGSGTYPIWQNDTAQNTQPIREFGLDPIDAFLNYFVE